MTGAIFNLKYLSPFLNQFSKFFWPNIVGHPVRWEDDIEMLCVECFIMSDKWPPPSRGRRSVRCADVSSRHPHSHNMSTSLIVIYIRIKG